MSKLSEDLESALSIEASDGIGAAMKRVISREKAPGYDAMSRHTHGAAVTLLRTARYHFAGAAPWENGEVAIEATAIFMQQDLMSFMAKTLAGGMDIGEHIAADDVDYTEVINSSGFQLSATIRALTIAHDHAAMDQISQHIAGGVAAVSEAMGFRERTGKEVSHIWDVWYGAMGSTSMSLYEAGYSLGQKYREEAILNGIVQATQSEVSE